MMTELLALSWLDVWAMPWARAVIGVVVLCILIAAGFYVVSSFRDYSGDDRQMAYFADSNLQEMLRRGDISEAEFRTIKSKSYGASVTHSGTDLSRASTTPANSDAEPPRDLASRVDEVITPESPPPTT